MVLLTTSFTGKMPSHLNFLWVRGVVEGGGHTNFNIRIIVERENLCSIIDDIIYGLPLSVQSVLSFQIYNLQLI